jgi:hypothetical protein
MKGLIGSVKREVIEMMENNKDKSLKNEKSYIVYLKQMHDKKYYDNQKNVKEFREANNKPTQKEDKKGRYF